jgi:hypothetical protein
MKHLAAGALLMVGLFVCPPSLHAQLGEGVPDALASASPSGRAAVPVVPYNESHTLIASPEGEAARAERKWWVSVLALGAANALDIHSSWGRQELNPALRGSSGTFSGRGVAIKAGLMGGFVVIERLLARRDPALYRRMSYINYGIAGAYTGVAVRNYRSR